MRISGALPLLCLVGALAGCGGGAATSAPAPTATTPETSRPAVGDSVAIVRQAVERSTAESYRYVLQITEADGPISGEGEYTPGPPVGIRESFTFSDPEYGEQKFERVALGAEQWFRAALGGTDSAPDDGKWLKAQAFGGGPNETLGPFDLRERLPLLTTATDLRPDGEETIDGTRTVRYRATAVGTPEPTSFEVCIDSEGRIRRFVQSSTGSNGVTLAEVTLRDFGAALAVTPPPADQIAGAPTASPAPSF